MFRPAKVVALALTLALVGLLLGNATGQQGGKSETNKRETGKNKPQAIAVTPEREAAVTTFVKRNHAELADLLAHLKANQPQEYERAVRDLYRITERLASIQERDPTQYDLELTLWTAQSRVQLFTAKLKMGTTDELKSELRQALDAQAEARVALLKHERTKVVDRLSRIDGDIAQLEGEREKLIDKQLELLVRTARQGKEVKLGPKGAVSKPVNKPSAKRAGSKTSAD
ncbi:MAG TPA: hypothetical protein VFV87_13680 [Pirellulaceae bacterium]|nr:hypothetical protein [Pirellulaceae bacterium]